MARNESEQVPSADDWKIEHWMIWGAVLTSALLVAGFALAPVAGMRNQPPLAAFLYWMNVWMLVGLVLLLGYITVLRLRVQGPLMRHVLDALPRARLLSLSIGMVLVAANLTAFGFLKPELDHLIAFSADPLLASIDRSVIGQDGWRVLAPIRHVGMGTVYHGLWLAWLVTVVVIVLLRSASRDKDALLIGYFLMWTVFGPLVHMAMPAAGPVFYETMGFGTQFTELEVASEDTPKLDYLLVGYRTRSFNPGGGISAMPSLHIATMAWSVLAVRKTRLVWIAVFLTIYMWLSSIVLGWHYAIDGLAGVLIAGAGFAIGRLVCRRDIDSSGGTVRATTIGQTSAKA